MSLASALLAVALAAIPSFDAIVGGVGARPRTESCRQMEQWLQENPTSPEVPRGLLWIARLRAMDGEAERGRPELERVLRDFAGTEWDLRATKELADLDVQERHWTAALAGYQKLADNPQQPWKQIGSLALLQVRPQRERYFLFEGLALALLLFGVARLALAARAGLTPWKPPTEILVGAPVIGMLLLAALAQPPAQAKAVQLLALGGAFLVWANGALLSGARWTLPRRILESVLGLAQAAALLYCAVVAAGLWDNLVHTMIVGVE